MTYDNRSSIIAEDIGQQQLSFHNFTRLVRVQFMMVTASWSLLRACVIFVGNCIGCNDIRAEQRMVSCGLSPDIVTSNRVRKISPPLSLLSAIFSRIFNVRVFNNARASRKLSTFVRVESAIVLFARRNREQTRRDATRRALLRKLHSRYLSRFNLLDRPTLLRRSHKSEVNGFR